MEQVQPEGGGLDDVMALLASLHPDQDRKAVLELIRPTASRHTRQEMELGIQQVKQFELHGSPSLPASG